MPDQTRPNDRKAAQEKKGQEMERRKDMLINAVDRFNNEFGYDYELTRKSQTRIYSNIVKCLKSSTDDALGALLSLHPWLRGD